MPDDALLDAARLAAVRRSGLLDTPPEEPFDRLAGLASELLDVPFAFVTVVDERRSFWKSCIGVAGEGAPTENTVQESFCQYVVSSGEPLVLGDVREAPLTRDNPSIASMGVVAWAGYPVHSPDGEVLGTFCVVDTVPRDWSDRDVRVLDTLSRAASSEIALRMRTGEAERAAADAAHHAEDAEHVAVVLQRSMLTAAPQPDHLDVAVRYRPAATHHQVGGDWYDAFMQPDGATVLVIGDVAGHDIAAAAAMGQIRNLVRAIGYHGRGAPARILCDVDDAMRGLEVDAAATAVVARIEQPDRLAGRGVRRLRWSSAGHLPPLLLSVDGTVCELRTTPELLLGVDPTAVRCDHETDLPPGSTLLLYTDGLVERRDRSLGCGIAALAEALAGLRDLPLEPLCDALLSATLPHAPTDDVAVLAVRAHPEDGGSARRRGQTFGKGDE